MNQIVASTASMPAAPNRPPLIRRCREALTGSVFGSRLYRLSLGGRKPPTISVTPPAPAFGDPELGRSIVRGALPFAGRPIPLGRAPWTAVTQGPQAAAWLHGFAWLVDLQAVGGDEARRVGRELVSGWLEHNEDWSTPAWRPDVLGRRLYAWLTASDWLWADDTGGRDRMAASLAAQARHLARVRPDDAAREAMAAAKGRLAAACCLAIGRIDAATRDLMRIVDLQVLPDGTPLHRSPEGLFHMLRDAIDAAALLQASGETPPEELRDTIKRVVPVLRMLRLGDGALCAFHGGGRMTSAAIDAVLAASGERGSAVDQAPDGGFVRLRAGRTTVIVDVGSPPSDARGHDAPLAFEMSAGRDRLVIGCGGYAGDDPAWRDASQATAAHSTVVVADTDAVDAAGVTVVAQRRRADGAVWLDGRHDGYARRFGIQHIRRLYLSADGDDLRGEDVLDGDGDVAFQARFHLDPCVNASPLEGGSVLLRLPGSKGWRFTAIGGAVSLEESVALVDGGTPRRCMQIVVSGRAEGAGGRVKWAFRRETAATR